MLAALILASAVELRLELVRHSLTGTHCRYREYVHALPTDRHITKPCGAAGSHPAQRVEMPAVQAPAAPLRIANGRVVRRVIVHESPLHPWAHDYDPATGELIARTPLFFNGKPARVFDPNPVVALNDPTLQDRNDSAAAVPESAYELVELEVSGPGLRGPYVTIVDKQLPAVPPIDADASLLLDRSADGFEDVNAFFHIDRNQRYLQSLGYTGSRAIAPYAIEVDTHAAGGADNSLFVPSATMFGRGSLYFGEGGTDDAEDADLVVHEYAHALLEWIAPGTFGGTFAAQSRALGEGFGDYWAYSAHVSQRLASGRDPFCFADWDARCWEDDPSQRCAYPPGSDCLRRLDSPKTMADYVTIEAPGVEHRNGAIWSSALRELHQHLGRETADTIVLESLFDVPPSPTFEVMARRMLAADRLLFNGAHAEAICAPMIRRGILTTCENLPRGELTLFPSADVALPIPDNNTGGVTSRLLITDPRTIENVYVQVDIEHATRGDLRIELVAPDGTVVVLQQIALDRGPDVRTTFGLTGASEEPLEVLRGMSAAGTWQLIVRDQRARDAGTLRSWGLVFQFAGDAPLSERPRAALTRTIPVVTHVYGVGANAFASDLRIANVNGAGETTTLIFTRSGEDGRTRFAAVKIALDPGQTAGFEDVVATLFGTSGSGTLEVLGDVVVMSRITNDGIGESVPPAHASTAVGEPPLFANPSPRPNARTNLGISEIAGAAGVLSVDGVRVEILPFSHVQFPIEAELTEIRVASGGARVVAYVSQPGAFGADALFIPAESLPMQQRTLIAPAIHASGVGQSRWETDLWIRGGTGATARIEAIAEERAPVHLVLDGNIAIDDVLGTYFAGVSRAALRLMLPAGAVAGARIGAPGPRSQFVPLLDPHGPAEQHLLFIESSEELRTNIGIVSDGQARAEVTIYDASGVVVATMMLQTAGGLDQAAVLPRVVRGRARVRFELGRGRAYASLVENSTGDPTYIAGQ